MDRIEKIFKKMIGQVCWGIHDNRLINLSFQLGQPRLEFEECKNDPERDRRIRKYTGVQGRWFVWVYLAYWTLTVFDVCGNKKLKAVTTSTNRKRARVSLLLQGQRLTGISIDHQTGATRLSFDSGAELKIRRRGRDTKQVWLLYDDTGYCLEVHGDGTYDYIPSSSLDRRRTVENASIQNDITAGVTTLAKK